MVSSIFFTQSTDENANLFQKQLRGTLRVIFDQLSGIPQPSQAEKNNHHSRSKTAAITFRASFVLDKVRGRNEGTGSSSLSSLQTSNSASLRGLCWPMATLDLPPDTEVTALYRFLHQLPLAISVLSQISQRASACTAFTQGRLVGDFEVGLGQTQKFENH